MANSVADKILSITRTASEKNDISIINNIFGPSPISQITVINDSFLGIRTHFAPNWTKIKKKNYIKKQKKKGPGK